MANQFRTVDQRERKRVYDLDRYHAKAAASGKKKNHKRISYNRADTFSDLRGSVEDAVKWIEAAREYRLTQIC